jgi:hypothetical protein
VSKWIFEIPYDHALVHCFHQKDFQDKSN